MKKSELIQVKGQEWYNEYQKSIGIERDQKKFTIDGTPYNRIPWGSESGREVKSDELCHDCLAELGMLHSLNCDMEDCPKCKRQALSCPCEIVEYTEKI